MKKVFTITVAAALLVGITVVPVLAAGGPAEKATGGVDLVVVVPGPDNDTRHVEFNAHEPTDTRPAKGKFSWTQVRAGVTQWFLVDIENIVVDGNEASFNGVVIATNPATAGSMGKRLYVRVVDNATPGAGGDKMYCFWEHKPTLYEYDVIAGNLVVHTYGD